MPLLFESYLFVTTLLILAYAGILIWGRSSPIDLSEAESETIACSKPKIGISILVPFRNEASHIQCLCESLEGIRYPTELFEIIAINDHSEDHGAALFQANSKKINFSLVQLEKGVFGKKAALLRGAAEARFPYLMSTDADCILPPDILLAYDTYLRSNPEKKFVAGPIVFSNPSNQLLFTFQMVDLAATMQMTKFGIESGRAFMANGANYLVETDLFRSVASVSYTPKKSSGDDVFLVQAIARIEPNLVGFIWSHAALVRTAAQKNWAGLVRQRIRWASKSSQSDRSFIFWLQVLTFVLSWSVIGGLFLCWWDIRFLVIGGVIFVLKMLLDYYFVKPTLRFQDQRIQFWSYVGASGIYLLYIVAMGLVSLNPNIRYRWKGRLIK